MFSHRSLPLLATLSYSLVFFTCAYAKPHGFHLKSGDAKAPFLESGAWVIQSGKKTMIDWESFSIDQKEIVRFQQMDAHSYVLNRVTGGSESALLGQLLSNGSVYLINPNGILIGPNAYIETAGFIASTLDLLNEDLSGKALRFSGDNEKGVINKGIIHCPAGDIFLIGRQVENEGTLSSPQGRQGLLSGCDVLIQPKGAPQILIRSDQILDTKELAENPYALAIRHTGSSSAQEIYLATEEGLCEVSGSITAQEGEKGGTVHLLGENVHLLDGARIDASGPQAGGTVLIGGDYQGKNPEIKNAKHVWAGQDTQVRADALENGDGGKVIFWSDEATLHYGKISICGGAQGGNGGLAEVSGHTLEYRGFTDGRAPLGQTGMLLLDPNDVVINTAVTTTGTFSACVPPVSYNFVTGTGTNQILNTDLQTQLASCNVTIDTTSSGGSGTNAGSVTVSSAVSWSAATTLTLKASSFMSITAGITNTNAGGPFSAMNFTANGTSAVANPGITLSGASAILTTTSGNVTLNGTSSTAATGSHGVSFSSGRIVTGSGAISVTGTVPAGSAATANGIIMNINNAVTSTSGNITLSGSSSATGASSHGVSVTAGFVPVTTGSVTFSNCAGGTGTASNGVNLPGGVLTCGGDLIFNTCTGGNNGTTGGSGVLFPTSAVTIAGSLTATSLLGQGNGGIGFNVLNSTQITTVTGVGKTINITASSNGTTGASHGISIQNGLRTSGGGSITLNGTGGASSTASHGIFLSSSQAFISTTGGGSISLTGVSPGGSGANIGILSTSSGIAIGTTVAAPITLNGSSAASGTGSHGVSITGGSMNVYTSLTITGSGGLGAASHGFNTFNNTFGNGSSGTIICNGTPGTGAGSYGNGIGSTFTTAAGSPITFFNSVLLTANPSTSSAATGANITFSGSTATIDGSTAGGQNLTINAGTNGVVTFGGLIGSTTGIGILTISAKTAGANAILLPTSITAGTFAVSTVSSTTLTGNTTITTTGAPGTMTFGGSIEGAFDLNLITGGTGGIGFSAGIGAISPLTKLSITSSGQIVVGNNITLTGANPLIFPSPTSINGTSNITSNNAPLTFASTLNRTLLAGVGNLTLTAGTGTISFNGAVGGTTVPLNSLVFASANLIRIGSNITMVGDNPLTFPFPVSLIGDSIITPNNNSLTFNSTIDGTQALTVNAGTNTTAFNGNVGGTTPLGAVTVNGTIGTGAFSIGSAVTALRASAFAVNTVPVTLNNVAPLTIDTSSGNGNVSFASTVNGASAGAQALTVNAGSGNIFFNGSVGNLVSLGALGISNATNVTASGLIRASSLTQTAGSGTTMFNDVLNIGANISLTGTNFTFNGTTVTGNDLTIANSGTFSVILPELFFLNGAFLQSGTGPVQMRGSITTGNQNISFNSPVTLNGNVNFDTGGTPGNILFNDTVNGTQNMVLNAGNVNFSNVVGGITPLRSLRVVADGTITTAGNQTVSTGPMLYDGNVVLTAHTQFTDNGASPMTFSATAGNSITGNFNLTLTAPNTSISVDRDVVLTGSNGSSGGTLTASSSTGLTFVRQILTQGGAASPGIGGQGGSVTLAATAGSISVHNIHTSGGTGTVSGGNAGDILIQPASGYNSGLPVGLIVLNEDVSSLGNLVALAGGGGGGVGGTITLSASRTAPATVATITSSSDGNNIAISGLNFVMGPNEAMTGLGNITLLCPQMTLGDIVALDNLNILATGVNLLTHGDESILDKFGNLYISPSLHFLGGTGYTQTGIFNPPGPVNAQNLNVSNATFLPLLILGDPVILNFDTSLRPPSPSVTAPPQQPSIYKLLIADAELSDLLPVGPCPEPYKLRHPRCPLPALYELTEKKSSKSL